MFMEFLYWLAYFYIYCFIGWCIESAIVSVSQRKLTNRGFMKGPFLPIYGFGALAMLLSSVWLPRPEGIAGVLLVYVSGMIAATLLELLAGVLIENLLKMKYWDYSDNFCNFKGYICLKSSLFWGVLTVVLVFFIHEPVAAFVKSLSKEVLTGVLGVLSAFVLLDLVTSYKAAFDVQKLLAYQTRLAEEMEEIRIRLAEARKVLVDTRENLMEKRAQLEDFIHEQEKRKEHLLEELGRKKESARRGLLRLKNYPTARSKKFGRAFSEWKTAIKEKH